MIWLFQTYGFFRWVGLNHQAVMIILSCDLVLRSIFLQFLPDFPIKSQVALAVAQGQLHLGPRPLVRGRAMEAMPGHAGENGKSEGKMAGKI